MRKPWQGAIVLYWAPSGFDGVHSRPAIVEHVHEDGSSIDIASFRIGHNDYHPKVGYSDKPGIRNTWTWPTPTPQVCPACSHAFGGIEVPCCHVNQTNPQRPHNAR